MSDQSYRVLAINLPGFRPIPDLIHLHLAIFQVEVVAISNLEALKSILSCVSPHILLCNAPEREIFAMGKSKGVKCTFLLTDRSMLWYSQFFSKGETGLIDGVIENRHDPTWAINEIRITLQIWLRKLHLDLKYFYPNHKIHSADLNHPGQRSALNEMVESHFTQLKLSSSAVRSIKAISEELLMNAFIDAPRSFSGMGQKNCHSFGKIFYVHDAHSACVAVTDPFGGLKKSTLFAYLQKAAIRDKQKPLSQAKEELLIDQKAEGAGLGLLKILYHAHGIHCMTIPKASTTVAAFVGLSEPLRDFAYAPRTIIYHSAYETDL